MYKTTRCRDTENHKMHVHEHYVSVCLGVGNPGEVPICKCGRPVYVSDNFDTVTCFCEDGPQTWPTVLVRDQMGNVRTISVKDARL